MKRLPYISIIVVATAVSALLLNSCCKHKIEIVQQGEVIDFGVSEKKTKAVVENMDSLVSYCFADPDNPTGFGVYGYKTVLARNNDTLSSDRTFDNYEVIPTEKSASTSWTYSPLRYWDSWTEDRKVDYHFVAYWPHMSNTQGNGMYVSEQDKILTIHNIPNWQDGTLAASADLMTAKKDGYYKEGYFRLHAGAVPFQKVNFEFKHLLAKLTIRAFYKGDKNAHVFIQGLSFSGADFLSNGTVNYREAFGGQQSIENPGMSTPVRDNLRKTLFTGQVELGDDAFDDENVVPEGEEDPTPYTPVTVCTWLVVPSTGWQDLGLDISYGIGQGSRAVTTTLNVPTIDTNQSHQHELLASHSYVINLKFDSSSGGIQVDSVYVKDWTDVNVSKPVYNW